MEVRYIIKKASGSAVFYSALHKSCKSKCPITIELLNPREHKAEGFQNTFPTSG